MSYIFIEIKISYTFSIQLSKQFSDPEKKKNKLT
jgi:hypothetical protein